MSTVEEIKSAISSLSKEDYIHLRKWFSEKDWEQWDEERRISKKHLTFNLVDILLIVAHLPCVEGVTRSLQVACERPQLFLTFPLTL